MPTENTNPEYWFNQGQAYQANQSYYAAIYNYGKAIQYQPDYWPAYQALGSIVQFNIDWNNGQQYWEQLSKLCTTLIATHPHYSALIQFQLAQLETLKLHQQMAIYQHHCTTALAYARKCTAITNNAEPNNRMNALTNEYNYYSEAVMYAKQWSLAAHHIHQYNILHFPDTASTYEDETVIADGMFELSSMHAARTKKELNELSDGVALERPSVIHHAISTSSSSTQTETTQNAVAANKNESNNTPPAKTPVPPSSTVSYIAALMKNQPSPIYQQKPTIPKNDNKAVSHTNQIRNAKGSSPKTEKMKLDTQKSKAQPITQKPKVGHPLFSPSKPRTVDQEQLDTPNSHESLDMSVNTLLPSNETHEEIIEISEISHETSIVTSIGHPSNEDTVKTTKSEEENKLPQESVQEVPLSTEVQLIFQLDEWYQKGEEARTNGQFKEAVDCYTEALNIHPSTDIGCHRLARFHRAMSHAELSNHSAAIEDFTVLINTTEKDDQDSLYNIYCQRGMAYFSQENYENARKDYQAALAIYPSLSEAHFGLGAVAHKEIIYYNAFNELVKEYMFQGYPVRTKEQGRFTPAELKHSEFCEIIKTKQTEAKDHYERALRKNPEAWEVYWELGELAISQGKIDEAEKYYNKISHNAEYKFVLPRLVAIHIEQKKYERVIKNCQKIITDAFFDTQEKAIAYSRCGFAHEQLNDKTTAIEQYQLALKMDPHCNEAHTHLNHLQSINKKKSKKAKKSNATSEIAANLSEQVNAQASTLETKLQSYLRELAEHKKEGRLAIAIEFCGKIMSEGSGIAIYQYKANCELGSLMAFWARVAPSLSIQYYKKAFQCFMNALTLYGQDLRELPDVYFEIGAMYYSMKDYKNAEECCKIALSKAANSHPTIAIEGYPSCIIKANYLLGGIAMHDIMAIQSTPIDEAQRQLKIETMEAYYLKANVVPEHFPSVNIQLAEISGLKGNWDEAIQKYEAIISNTAHFSLFSKADKATVYYQCGKAYGNKKPRNLDKIIELFEMAVSLNPNNSEISQKLTLFKELKNMAEARKAGITGTITTALASTANTSEISPTEPRIKNSGVS